MSADYLVIRADGTRNTVGLRDDDRAIELAGNSVTGGNPIVTIYRDEDGVRIV